MNDSTQFPKEYRVYLTHLTRYIANGELMADAAGNGDFEEIGAFSAQDAAMEYMDIYLKRCNLARAIASITDQIPLTCKIIVHATQADRWYLFNLEIEPKLMIECEGSATRVERTKS